MKLVKYIIIVKEKYDEPTRYIGLFNTSKEAETYRERWNYPLYSFYVFPLEINNYPTSGG